MRKDKKAYNAKDLFLQGLLSFGRIFGDLGKSKRAAGVEQIHRTREEELKRRKSHAKFRAQRLARRIQRRK